MEPTTEFGKDGLTGVGALGQLLGLSMEMNGDKGKVLWKVNEIQFYSILYAMKV